MRILKQKTTWFLVILVVLLAISSAFCETLTTHVQDSRIQKRNALEIDFKNQPQDTIDIVTLGDSEAYTSFNTVQLWENNGYTSYVMALPGCLMSETRRLYYMMKEHQKPKVLMIETNILFRKQTIIKGIENIFMDKFSDMFEVFRMHDVWKMMFVKNLKVSYDKFAGFRLAGGIKGVSDISKYMTPSAQAAQIPEFSQYIIEDIVKDCKENDIQVVLYSAPSPKNYSMKRHNALVDLSSKLDVPFYDLNIDSKNLGIDWTKDTYDGGDHLNIHGAVKCTKAFEDILKNYSLSDHRGQKKYEHYQKMADKFNVLMQSTIAAIDQS